MQLNTSVRLGTVEKQRDTNVGEMTGYDDEKNGLPPVSRPTSEIGHTTTPYWVRAIQLLAIYRTCRTPAIGDAPTLGMGADLAVGSGAP